MGSGESRWAGESGGRGERFGRLLAAAAAALVALWLYRRALGFAYYNDDPTGHFAWMEGRTVVDFFTSSAAYGYYRPVVFGVLRLSERLFGSSLWPHLPFADHALLLLLHATNTALVWALARRLGGRAGYAWVAALVFAALPFSYEAVAYVASLTHPLLVFWVLAAVVLYERRLTIADEATPVARPPTAAGRRLATGYWILITLLTLALLTHENGVFLLPALVGVDWLRRPHDGPAARVRRLWPLAVVVVLYLALWLEVPKNSEQGLNPPADLLGNAVPFLQSLVFPLLPLLNLDAGDVWPLAALTAGVTALFGWLAWRAGAARLWLFALGWVVLSAMPALLFLAPAYVFGSPRLSYLPAVGIGLLWGIPILWVERRVSNRVPDGQLRRYAPAVLCAATVVALVWTTRPFVTCQLDFYAETSRLVREMAIGASAAADGREVVFINAPFFFSSYPARPDGCPNRYPWTPTGGILVPPYAQARDFVRFNGGPDRPASGVAFPGYAPGWRTFGPEIDGAALRRAAESDAALVFDLARGGFFDLSVAWHAGDAPADALATFGGALALVGADVAQEGARLHVRLAWRVLSPPAAAPAIFVHVVDETGVPVAQRDGPPAGGFAPVALWRPGDGLTDAWEIDLAGVSPGNYDVVVGVYSPAGGERFAAEQNGRRLPNDALPLGEVVR